MARNRWISIHALFAEGDEGDWSKFVDPAFLSTPSSQRATRVRQRAVGVQSISIHALFAEGDDRSSNLRRIFKRISIHALFAEGDRRCQGAAPGEGNFYPRPLRRGRRGNGRLFFEIK